MFESKAPLHRVAGSSNQPADSPANPVPFRFFTRFNGPDDVVCRSLNCAPGRDLATVLVGQGCEGFCCSLSGEKGR